MPRVLAVSTQGGEMMSIISKRARWLGYCACGALPFLSLPTSAADAEDARVELEEIVITGSRLGSRDLEGHVPVILLGREEIERLGASSVHQVLKFVPQLPYIFSETRTFGAAQFAELRGLGASTTLVLINGRRAVASGPNVSSNAFDLNTIPLAAVERIEVLSDSASAVYGADAMGGVVNIILKKEIPRPVLNLEFGSAHGGGEEQRASLSLGAKSERVRSSFIFDYYARDHLLGAERERWRDQDYRRFGGQDRRSLNASPGNVASRAPGNLPGLTSSFAAIPKGSSGVGLTPADFTATQGQRNFASLERYRSIVSKAERYSAALFAEVDLLPNTVAFAELLYTDRLSETQAPPPSLTSALVPAANPFNPFGVDVSVSMLLTGMKPISSVVEAESWRAVAGLRGALGRWDWELFVLNSDEDGRSWNENALSSVRMAAALAADDPSVAFNPFQDGPGGSPALLGSLLSERQINEYASNATQVSGFLRGDLLSLPAGAVEAVIGAEWRTEEVFQNSPLTFVSNDRHVAAGFGEVRVPLVDPSMGLRGANRVLINLAARYDKYNDFGSTFNPQYGIAWHVTPDVLVRASYGQAFRPPSLFELYSPRFETPGTQVVDPRRHNEAASVTTISGGNPNLQPIEGESMSAGFVLTPSYVSGLRLSTTYWRVKVKDRVSSFLSQLVLNNEALFADRVTREAPTSADVAAGLPGPVTAIDTSRVNFGVLETSGIDAQISYAFDTALGRFAPSVSATWVDSYEASQAPGTPPVERVGVANVAGTIPEWRGVLGVTWNRRSLAASLNARYVHGYKDATLSGAALDRNIPSQTFVDAQASIDIGTLDAAGSKWLSGLKLSAGVWNLFDRAPHFSDMSNFGYDLSQGDLRQRFMYVRLGKTF